MQPQQYVGIDLRRRRSVIVRRGSEGETLEVSRTLRAVKGFGYLTAAVLAVIGIGASDGLARLSRASSRTSPGTTGRPVQDP
jgi:hypothetical protein